MPHAPECHRARRAEVRFSHFFMNFGSSDKIWPGAQHLHRDSRPSPTLLKLLSSRLRSYCRDSLSPTISALRRAVGPVSLDFGVVCNRLHCATGCGNRTRARSGHASIPVGPIPDDARVCHRLSRAASNSCLLSTKYLENLNWQKVFASDRSKSTKAFTGEAVAEPVRPARVP